MQSMENVKEIENENCSGGNGCIETVLYNFEKRQNQTWGDQKKNWNKWDNGCGNIEKTTHLFLDMWEAWRRSEYQEWLCSTSRHVKRKEEVHEEHSLMEYIEEMALMKRGIVNEWNLDIHHWEKILYMLWYHLFNLIKI